MKHKILFAIATVLFCLPGSAQTPGPGSADYLATSLTFVLDAPPQPVNINQISVQMLDNPGNGTFCYWIVSNFLIGNSGPAGPRCIANGPNTLSSGIRVSWAGVPGATSFDVLRTSNQTPPAGACACAVATSVTTQTATDTGLNAYTVSTFNPSSLNIVMANEPASAGVSNIAFRVQGSKVFSITSAGGLSLNNVVLPEGAAPAGIVASDILFGDSTAHRLKMINNNGSADLVTGANTTDTFTNKTIDTAGPNTIRINGNTLAASAGVATVTVPNSTDTLVGRATTDTLSNKTIDTAGPNTLRVNGNTLAASAGVATVTVPNSTDTLVARATTDTLTNKTIDTAGPNTIRINGNTLAATAGAATVTVPNSTDTLVARATTDTLTNKTIDTAGPNTIRINGNTLSATAGAATVTVPNSTDTLVARATTDTLTNKTLVGAASGNSVNLAPGCAPQDTNGPITGDGTDKTIYTCSLTANVLAANKCLHISIGASTGNATATTYKIFFGATAVWTGTSAAATDNIWAEAYVCNNAAVQNAQHSKAMGFAAATATGNVFTSPAENTANAVTIKLTGNVANPNTFSGKFWEVVIHQ